ncbi:MAG: toll/interleukin-1 receptor domain-containing protein [Pseudomonadales bacterium]|nr:toll/interleukin-1 receptor domain-containing protein [Pseudomonadales bacterium]
MTAIFVSYRRADTSASAGRICDRLQAHFGDDQVFQDVDTVPLGVDFRTFVAQKLEKCDVLLVVMGDDWLGAEAGQETRRIDRPDDLVRLEVEAALQRDIPVIPVLVGARPVPSEQELPESLKDLSYRNGVEVRMDASFEGQLARLITAIESVLGRDRANASPPAPPAPDAGAGRGLGKFVLAGVVGAALLLGLLLMLPEEPESSAASAEPSATVDPASGNGAMPSWPTGSVTLRDGAGFSFAMEALVDWHSGDADILVQALDEGPYFFVQHDAPPYNDAQADVGAAGGMYPAPSAADADDCSWNYEEDYAYHFFEPGPDGVYCVLDRRGAAVAKIWLTEISEASISFDWSYFVEL